MEYCKDKIQITFSPPELEVVRRALEEFGHVEAPEPPSINPLPAVNVIRILDKLESVPSDVPQKSSTGKKASIGDSSFHGSIFNCKRHGWFARLPRFFKRRFSHGWGHKEKRFQASREGLGGAYLFSKDELEEIM